jgi:hypothetical protein
MVTILCFTFGALAFAAAAIQSLAELDRRERLARTLIAARIARAADVREGEVVALRGQIAAEPEQLVRAPASEGLVVFSKTEIVSVFANETFPAPINPVDLTAQSGRACVLDDGSGEPILVDLHDAHLIADGGPTQYVRSPAGAIRELAKKAAPSFLGDEPSPERDARVTVALTESAVRAGDTVWVFGRVHRTTTAVARDYRSSARARHILRGGAAPGAPLVLSRHPREDARRIVAMRLGSISAFAIAGAALVIIGLFLK